MSQFGPYMLAFSALLIGTTWLALQFFQNRTNRRILPPGPSGWPLVGNIVDFPKRDRWITFSQWAKQYGDMTYVNLLGSDIIIVNTLSVLSVFHETNATICSDRPYLYFAYDMVGWRDLALSMDIGPEHTAHRKLIAKTIGTKAAIATFQDKINHQVRYFMKHIIDQPEHLYRHVRTLAAGIILSITYGYNVDGPNDKFVIMAEKVAGNLGAVFAPGAYLVDTIPAMKYLPAWAPGGGFKKEAAAMRADRDRFMDEPYEFVLKCCTEGAATTSFVEQNFGKESGETASHEHMIKWVATLLYLGGADTSVSIIYTFILCMLLHPAAQQKAQDEIASVLGVGSETLPRAQDQSRLPYVEACWKESLRWHPALPDGVAHRTRSDMVYDGYHIPKGTTLLSNIWLFAHNTETYTDPSCFRPERFLGETPELDPRKYVFGVGRRVCPGQLLAENTIFTLAVHLLALVDILPASSATEVKLEYQGAVATILNEFPVRICPRSSRTSAILDAALAATA